MFRDPSKSWNFPLSARDALVLKTNPNFLPPTINIEGKVLDIDALIRDLSELYILAKNRSQHSAETATELKSSVRAIQFREAGNERFKRARDDDALELYTKSIATAPERSEELALAYANRSAVLFRTCRYVPCLLDINRALQSDYPKSLAKKLQDRKKQCLAEIRLASEYDKKLKRIKADATQPLSSKSSSSKDAEWRSLCKFGNPLIPNASSKIRIESDENWGRYLVTTADIEPGEILSWQKFFVLTVGSDKQCRNCSYCLSRCYSLLPCPSCPQMYCSKHCRKQAYNSYHRIECKMMMYRPRNFSSYEEDVYFTAVRMMLVGTEQGAQLRNLMKRFTIRDIFAEKTDPTNRTFSSDYVSVLRLSRTYNPSFLKLHIMSVAEMIVSLQRVAFFKGKVCCPQKEEHPDSLNGTEIFTAMLLMNHIAAATGNRFSITSLSSSDLAKRDATSTVGSGVCPLHNFLNHSCDGQVNFFTRRRKHVLIALRPIKKHEQLFFSYFNSFASNPIRERTKVLSSFGFTCYCRACVNQWPVEPVLMERKTEFLTENKEKAIEALTRAMLLILKEDVMSLRNQEILRILCKVRKWLYSNVKEPSISALHCENRLLFFMMLLYDDFSREFMNEESKECIKLTLAAIRLHTLTKS